jgi:membrane-bound lytic murein transglycosylase B
MMKRLALAFALFIFTLSSAFAGLADRPDVKAFISEMVEKHGFKRSELVSIMNKATIQQSIIDAMNRPAEGKPWYQYRPIFITEQSINSGVAYYQTHKDALKRAEREYGVPAEMIVAIIGVETRYGKNKGSYSVLDALSTLAFDYPKRAPFFKSELEAFLLLTREEKIDPTTLKGSYAGAMGTPQFMPSSYRAWAVDFTGNGKRNLWDNDTDAIGSVANYFAKHGWQKNEPIAFKAQLSTPIDIPSNVVKPTTPFKVYKSKGVKISGKLPDEALTSLLAYDDGQSHEYWLGLNNFYVITKYNSSPLYALAVYQLSEEIKARI